MFKTPTLTNESYMNGMNITYVINNGNDVIDSVFVTAPWNTTPFYDSTNVTSGSELFDDVGFIVKNIKLLKAVVLCVVVLILILTMGKFVLRVFSSYVDGDRKDEEMVQHT